MVPRLQPSEFIGTSLDILKSHQTLEIWVEGMLVSDAGEAGRCLSILFSINFSIAP